MYYSRVSFLSIVLRVMAYIRTNLRSNPTSARFGANWQRRARQMSDDRLARAFKTMLSSLPLRAVARLHRTIFRGHRAAVRAAGEMLNERGLLNVNVLRQLFEEWEEFRGEFKRIILKKNSVQVWDKKNVCEILNEFV